MPWIRGVGVVDEGRYLLGWQHCPALSRLSDCVGDRRDAGMNGGCRPGRRRCCGGRVRCCNGCGTGAVASAGEPSSAPRAPPRRLHPCRRRCIRCRERQCLRNRTPVAPPPPHSFAQATRETGSPMPARRRRAGSTRRSGNSATAAFQPPFGPGLGCATRCRCDDYVPTGRLAVNPSAGA